MKKSIIALLFVAGATSFAQAQTTKTEKTNQEVPAADTLKPTDSSKEKTVVDEFKMNEGSAETVEMPPVQQSQQEEKMKAEKSKATKKSESLRRKEIN